MEYRPDKEPTPEQPAIDKESVLNKLFEFAKELDIDIVEEDVAWLQEETFAGEDDAEFLEWLVSLAAQNGVDHEELLQRLGIDLEVDE